MKFGKPGILSLAVGLFLVAVLVGARPDRRPTPAAAASADTYVAAWDAIGAQAFGPSGLNPPDGGVIFAYEGIAVYDSVMAIKGGYEPFAIHVQAAPSASAEAAVASAAHRIFANFMPAQAASIIDPAYTTSLATIADSQAKADGIALGEVVAEMVIAWRGEDGFRGPQAYTTPFPPVPGVWIPTATTPPIATYMPFMTPFSLTSPDQFRPAGPPGLDSQTWADDFNETKALGGRTSVARTAAQTVVGRFWGEPPVQQAHGAFRKFVLDRQLDIVDASRVMAMIEVSAADAFIACADAKYHYARWRPVTAIPAGETDANDATAADSTWLPLLPATPNHPEYPAFHSCITPTAGVVIARFLGTNNIDFTIPSLTGLGDRHYATVQELATEVSNGRIWGGVHYRTSVNDGLAVGMKVTEQVLSHHFQRVVS